MHLSWLVHLWSTASSDRRLARTGGELAAVEMADEPTGTSAPEPTVDAKGRPFLCAANRVEQCRRSLRLQCTQAEL